MLLRTLVATSDPTLQRKLIRSIADTGSVIATVQEVGEFEHRIRSGVHDLVLVDHQFFEQVGLAVEVMRASAGTPEVVILTDDDGPERRAELLAAGCLAVIDAGLDRGRLAEVLSTLAARQREAVERVLPRIPDEGHRLEDYASSSPVMQRFLAMAQRIARRDSTLLLLGETGVGKGLFARSIHNESPRSGKPFVAVNCGALTETLLESELFGHEKGAFTGATRSRRGYFELAHGGTVFLDEISELPLHLQVKLLKVLEDRKVQPLGSEEPIRVDVRIMAAANRDLGQEVRENRFRSDLYYRLNVVVLRLPNLRERSEDIPELVESYIEHFRGRTGGDVQGIEPGALRALRAYPWPGNVRELINVVERAVMLCVGDHIAIEDLPDEMTACGGSDGPTRPTGDTADVPECPWLEHPWAEARQQALTEIERRYFEHQLARTRGRVGEAARRAGIAPRSLHEKMKRIGLRKEDFRPGS